MISHLIIIQLHPVRLATDLNKVGRRLGRLVRQTIICLLKCQVYHSFFAILKLLFQIKICSLFTPSGKIHNYGLQSSSYRVSF